MNSKEYLTNRAFCPVPWTGLMYNFDGTVKNCIRSAEPIGNINNHTIEEILDNDYMIKADMRAEQKFDRCNPCYDLEQEKNNLNIISDRIFYLKELRGVDTTLYDTTNFALHTVDVRWSNLCNFACIYCEPIFSSKWADELKIKIKTPTDVRREEFKNYIFKHVAQLKHVYMAGGEPLLMKENLEFLELLREKNPDVNLRINTNLSKVNTRIFDLICTFKNVHWTVSIETMEQQYEYIRYGGKWQDFIDNLTIINNLDHKISFNMLYFLLNYRSLFACIDFLKSMGFHNNSFIAGALIDPNYLNVRHLPDSELDNIANELQQRIDAAPGFLLENSYRNLLMYIRTPMDKNLSYSIDRIKELDVRRGLDSQSIFQDIYTWIK